VRSLYLADEEYRKKVHEQAKQKILEDEKLVQVSSGGINSLNEF